MIWNHEVLYKCTNIVGESAGSIRVYPGSKTNTDSENSVKYYHNCITWTHVTCTWPTKFSSMVSFWMYFSNVKTILNATLENSLWQVPNMVQMLDCMHKVILVTHFPQIKCKFIRPYVSNCNQFMRRQKTERRLGIISECHYYQFWEKYVLNFFF